MFTAVTQSRHFVLTSQLAFHLQPVIEESLSSLNDFQMLQGDVLIAFGLVVAIQLLAGACPASQQTVPSRSATWRIQ